MGIINNEIIINRNNAFFKVPFSPSLFYVILHIMTKLDKLLSEQRDGLFAQKNY